MADRPRAAARKPPRPSFRRRAGRDVERAQSQGRIEYIAHQHELVGARGFGERGEACGNAIRPTDHRGGEEVVDGSPLLRMQLLAKALHGRRQAAPVAAEDAEHALIGAAGEVVGLGVVRRRDHRHTDDRIGRGEHPEGRKRLRYSSSAGSSWRGAKCDAKA